jgi:hypothetical protein
MKMIKIAIIEAATITFVFSSHAQGTFQNLNFESANVGPITFAFSVPVANALPGWTVLIGNVQQTEVAYNAPSTGAPIVSLLGPPDPALEGNYSAVLTGAVGTTASISQTGLIPSGTASLFFEAQPGGTGNLAVSIDSEDIALVRVATFPTYTLYGANISAWSGETEPLTFTALSAPFGVNPWAIDDISFSPTAVVPEPNPLALTGIGGLLFALSRRFAPKLSKN